MRKTTVNGTEIASPFLTVDQAAAYLGISRHLFLAAADRHQIPFAVFDKLRRRRRYHVHNLRELARLMEVSP